MLVLSHVQHFATPWTVGLEKAMATHSSILAWRIPWTEDPGRPQVHTVTKSRIRLK